MFAKAEGEKAKANEAVDEAVEEAEAAMLGAEATVALAKADAARTRPLDVAESIDAVKSFSWFEGGSGGRGGDC